MMLENAREHGVKAYEGVHVLEVLFEGERAVGVKIRETADGSRREVRAKVVVDASGQAAMLQNRFKLRLWDPVLNKGAIWTYWEGAYRDTGRDEGATLVLQTADKQRLVLVHPAARQHRQRRRRRAVRLPVQGTRADRTSRPIDEEVENAPGVKERLANATRVTGYFVTRDYSYRSRAVRRRRLGAGRRRVRLPRSAVFLRRAARAASRASWPPTRFIEGLAKGDTSAAQLGAWGEGFNQGVDRMRRLVCEYYDGFSFGNFIRNHPELRNTVTDLLIGDLFTRLASTRCGRRWSRCISRRRRRFRRGRKASRRKRRRTRRNELVLPDGVRP